MLLIFLSCILFSFLLDSVPFNNKKSEVQPVQCFNFFCYWCAKITRNNCWAVWLFVLSQQNIIVKTLKQILLIFMLHMHYLKAFFFFFFLTKVCFESVPLPVWRCCVSLYMLVSLMFTLALQSCGFGTTRAAMCQACDPIDISSSLIECDRCRRRHVLNTVMKTDTVFPPWFIFHTLLAAHSVPWEFLVVVALVSDVVFFEDMNISEAVFLIYYVQKIWNQLVNISCFAALLVSTLVKEWPVFKNSFVHFGIYKFFIYSLIL